MAFTLQITKYILKCVPYLPTDGELPIVSDHKLYLFITPTQEPMNSAAPWRSSCTIPVILKRKVCGSTDLGVGWKRGKAGPAAVREEIGQEGSKYFRGEAWHQLTSFYVSDPGSNWKIIKNEKLLRDEDQRLP